MLFQYGTGKIDILMVQKIFLKILLNNLTKQIQLFFGRLHLVALISTHNIIPNPVDII